MANRSTIHQKLKTMCAHVYFQPPPSQQLQYPAIIYSLSGINKENANNSVYLQSRVYEVIVIDADPESIIVNKMAEDPKTTFVRSYVVNNLYHTVFKIY